MYVYKKVGKRDVNHSIYSLRMVDWYTTLKIKNRDKQVTTVSNNLRYLVRLCRNR